MKPSHLRGIVCVVAISILSCMRISAQTTVPLEPAQLPAHTMAYLIWRGTPAGDARKTNALLGLWDDPGFAPVRAAMFENMTADTGKDSSKPALTRDEAEQYSSLLENAFVAGYIPKPDRMTASAVPPKPSDHSWNGMFLAYDRTGKEVLLSKAVLRMRGSEKEMPKLSEINVSGVPVLKVERATSTTYWVEHGKYAVSASERSVLEEVLARLEGKSSGTSLAQSDAYKEAQPALGGGVIEFFAHLPNLRSVAPDASAQGVKVGPVLDAMKIDAIHSICGRVTLDGSKTRVQGALLGEAGSGTLFD